MAEAILKQFETTTACSTEEHDKLILALQFVFTGESRWKQIHLGFKKRADADKSLSWLKNRAKKILENMAESTAGCLPSAASKPSEPRRSGVFMGACHE